MHKSSAPVTQYLSIWLKQVEALLTVTTDPKNFNKIEELIALSINGLKLSGYSKSIIFSDNNDSEKTLTAVTRIIDHCLNTVNKSILANLANKDISVVSQFALLVQPIFKILIVDTFVEINNEKPFDKTPTSQWLVSQNKLTFLDIWIYAAEYLWLKKESIEKIQGLVFEIETIMKNIPNLESVQYRRRMTKIYYHLTKCSLEKSLIEDAAKSFKIVSKLSRQLEIEEVSCAYIGNLYYELYSKIHSILNNTELALNYAEQAKEYLSTHILELKRVLAQQTKGKEKQIHDAIVNDGAYLGTKCELEKAEKDFNITIVMIEFFNKTLSFQCFSSLMGKKDLSKLKSQVDEFFVVGFSETTININLLSSCLFNRGISSRIEDNKLFIHKKDFLQSQQIGEAGFAYRRKILREANKPDAKPTNVVAKSETTFVQVPTYLLLKNAQEIGVTSKPVGRKNLTIEQQSELSSNDNSSTAPDNSTIVFDAELKFYRDGTPNENVFEFRSGIQNQYVAVRNSFWDYAEEQGVGRYLQRACEYAKPYNGIDGWIIKGTTAKFKNTHTGFRFFAQQVAVEQNKESNLFVVNHFEKKQYKLQHK